VNTQRFSSKEQIGSSPLSYYGYRFYHADAQRWMNRDPFGSVTSQMNAEMFGTDAAAFYEEGIFDPELLPEGPNIYGYVGNNPINVVDPSGEVAPIVAVAAVAAVRGGFIAYRAYRSYRAAAAAARAGQSMIACSRSAAQRIATQAGKGARPVRHAPHGPRPDYRPHYHPGGNTPPHTHIWW
jgi:RHS repeat-associated protein